MRRGLLAILILVAAGSAEACPSCKDAVAHPAAQAAGVDAPPTADLAAGYDASILLMFSMPFVLLAGLGFLMFRATAVVEKSAPKE